MTVWVALLALMILVGSLVKRLFVWMAVCVVGLLAGCACALYGWLTKGERDELEPPTDPAHWGGL